MVLEDLFIDQRAYRCNLHQRRNTNPATLFTSKRDVELAEGITSQQRPVMETKCLDILALLQNTSALYLLDFIFLSLPSISRPWFEGTIERKCTIHEAFLHTFEWQTCCPSASASFRLPLKQSSLRGTGHTRLNCTSIFLAVFLVTGEGM